MPRSTKGLYKRGRYWWMTYFDCLGVQRWESCKTTNKKRAEAMLAKRQEEAREGILPEQPIKPIALDDLKTRYLAFVAHQRGVKTKHLSLCPLRTDLGQSADSYIDR